MAANNQLEVRIEPLHPHAGVIQLSGRHFIDEHGRVLDMRGANVGSASKVPIRPCPPFHAHAEATYVGRPFSLNEAREHWKRLRSWGLTFVRITVTWEAVEHAGPGQYDQAYLDFLRDLIIGMNEEGVAGYVVIHQDVFSRYCGGSGAPGWTVEAAGFDLSDDGDKLARTGSAFLDGVRGGRLDGERGLWPTGYQKLACATMSTLFWGGDTFAPSLKVKDQNGKEVGIQGYLQDAFLAMVDKVVETVGDLPGVLGFENYNTDLHLGAFPTPLQSFSAGSGHPTSVSNWVRTFPFPTRRSGNVLLNPTGLSVWRPDGPTAGECPWEKEGVWRWSDKKNRAVPLQSDYFTKDQQGDKVDFYEDFYLPFVKRWNGVIGSRQPGKARLVEGVPNEYCPPWKVEDRPGNMVYAPHWYDLNAMFKKSFGKMTVNVQGLSRGMFILNALYFTRDGAKRNYAKQIGTLVEKAREQLGEVPIVFGECGIPMDMNKEEAFKTGNWEWHERMMDALISALESSKVGFNLWSYNPANRDDIGDDWNAENFSWYSNYQRDLALREAGKAAMNDSDLDLGGRLLNVISRPYAVATAGEPIKIEYNYLTTEYTYRFHSPHRPGVVSATGAPATEHITEFFLPKVYVTNRAKVRHFLSLGGRVVFDYPNQRAYVWYVDTDRKDPQYTAMDGRSTRRFTMWVEGYYQEEGWALWQRLGMLVIFLGGLALAVYLQSVEWDRDRKLGFEPWKGVDFFKAKWDL